MASMCKCFMAAIFSWGRRLRTANESWAQALRCQNVIQWHPQVFLDSIFFGAASGPFSRKKNSWFSWIQRFDRISMTHRHTTPDSSPPGRDNLDNEMGSVAGSCLMITSRLWETEMTFHNPHPLYPTTITSSCRSCWALTWREAQASLISFEFCWKQSVVEIVEVAPATLELLKLASSNIYPPITGASEIWNEW